MLISSLYYSDLTYLDTIANSNTQNSRITNETSGQVKKKTSKIRGHLGKTLKQLCFFLNRTYLLIMTKSKAPKYTAK